MLYLQGHQREPGQREDTGQRGKNSEDGFLGGKDTATVQGRKQRAGKRSRGGWAS